MIGKFIRKILSKSEAKGENKDQQITSSLKEKSEKFYDFLNERFKLVSEEFHSIREKSKNLRETNYKLGMKHLDEGRLTDAIIRFQIIKKLWPDLHDAYYQLAYCFFLKGKNEKAKKLLIELLQVNPNYNNVAREFLEYLNKLDEGDENNA